MWKGWRQRYEKLAEAAQLNAQRRFAVYQQLAQVTMPGGAIERDAVQMVSALLMNGPEFLSRIRDETVNWMEEHEYESLRQMQGSMSLSRCPEPEDFTRANYMQILQSWKRYVSNYQN